jgi:hypothetical protein
VFKGIVFYSRDKIWTKILTDLGAETTDDKKRADVVFDPPTERLSLMELRADIHRQMDARKTGIIQNVFGKKNPGLSDTMEKIILMLYKHGGVPIKQLNESLGYSADTKTHTADTALYQLRKTFGADFIQQSNGIYSLGDRVGKL